MLSAPAEFFAGVGLLGRGLGLMVRRGRLFWLGALPPLITSVVFTGLLLLLVSEIKPFVRWLTGAEAGVGVTLGQVVVAFSLIVGSVVAMVLTFSTLTLAIGSPIYDRISEAVDAELGPVPVAPTEPVGAGVRRAVRQSAALIAVSLAFAMLFLLVGLIPVAGQIGAAVGSAALGGWLLCLELVGSPLERRGVFTLAGRRDLLRRRRWRVLGLAIPTFWLVSIPFLAVVVFPAATAAGTILARQLGDEPT